MNIPMQHRKLNLGICPRVASTTSALAIMLLLALVIGTSAQAQTFTLLYAFTGGADGGDPEGGLIMDSQGNLYGATAVGGNPACLHGCGTVFKVNTTGKESVLYSFAGTDGDGYFPSATLVQNVQGNLYGTTQVGLLTGTAWCSR